MIVDLVQGFENLVGQHAVGHFGGLDLFQQSLILAVALCGVQLDLEFLDLAFGRFQLQLLLIERDAKGLFFILGFGQQRFAMGNVRLGRPHLLRAAIEPLFQIAQLAMNAMQCAKDLGANSLWFWHCSRDRD